MAVKKLGENAVFIARMQGFHNAHLNIVRHSLERYDRLIIGIGSARQAPSPKNPWTADERIEMVKRTLTPAELDRVVFMPLRDYLYNDNQWITDVQQKVAMITNAPAEKISIVGRLKDKSSYYIRMFPQWKCDEYITLHPEDATKVRVGMFEDRMNDVREMVPGPVFDWLSEWKKTEQFEWTLDEHLFYEHYKAMHKFANPDLPYLPIFTTTDAVVVQSGHVLVVRRKQPPGKHLIALPGGHLDRDMTVENNALKELREESKIQIPRDELRKLIVSQRVFDHPERSLRGRTITHAFCIHLPDGELAKVEGGDDADKAYWMPLADLYEYEDKFFEDHVHMILKFTMAFLWLLMLSTSRI
jgi:bifunctional NMN adenylyltransferase/nudix hydrolase